MKETGPNFASLKAQDRMTACVAMSPNRPAESVSIGAVMARIDFV
jgi:hypothetical protein